LYRGSGQQQRFDQFALDYAQRFGRTPPVWFSTPELLASSAPPGSDPVKEGAWICPARLDASALQQLEGVLRVGSGTVRLDWRQIDAVSADLLPRLSALFARCCDLPLTLQWQGEDVLATFFRVHTPLGNNRVDAQWWKIRLDFLRILGQQADFEVVAMDYCITYEVSPPSWQPARSRRVYAQDSSALTTDFTVTVPPNALDAAQLTLSGELKGDVSASLRGQQTGGVEASALQVDCERLIRVDFAAAGSILNWVTGLRNQGQVVEFAQVPRLVAAFFSLIGINEHARIMVRVN